MEKYDVLISNAEDFYWAEDVREAPWRLGNHDDTNVKGCVSGDPHDCRKQRSYRNLGSVAGKKCMKKAMYC